MTSQLTDNRNGGIKRVELFKKHRRKRSRKLKRRKAVALAKVEVDDVESLKSGLQQRIEVPPII